MSYADHFQTKSTPQSEQADPRQVQNSAGGFTFALDKWARLERWLVLGSEGNTYYSTARQLTRENSLAAIECLKEDAKRAVCTIVDMSVSGRAPKNDPAIFALAIAAGSDSPEARKVALAHIGDVCRTGTHLFQFVTAVEGFRGWGRGLRRAIGEWYTSKDVRQLQVQVLKYQQRKGWSQRDLLRLAHVHAASAEQQAVLRWVACREAGDRVVAGKGSRKERRYSGVSIPEMLADYEVLKATKDLREIVRLIDKHGYTHEMLPSEAKAYPEVWEALLAKMPMMAMIRNLNKMTAVGTLTAMSPMTRAVCERLVDQDALQKARVHPIQVLSALRTYAQGHGELGELVWSPVREIVDSLDEGFYLSFATIAPTGKSMLLAIDVSGSMGEGEVAGAAGLTPRLGAAAMAMVTARSEKNWHCVGFSNGSGSSKEFVGRGTTLWGNRPSLIELSISPRQRLDDVCTTMEKVPAGGTDCALPMLYAAARDLKVDAFCVYCADVDTEILTAEGWRRYDGIRDGEEVYTLNHETGAAEWQRVTAVNVFPSAKREMLHMEGRGHSSLTTLDHRWPVRHRGSSSWGRRWKTSETLNQVDYIQCAAPDAGLPTTARWPDALVELVAWAWTEGCWNVSCALSIVQSSTVNPDNCERIRNALTELLGPQHTGSMYPNRYATVPLWVESGANDSGCIQWRLNQEASRQFTEILSVPEKVVSLPWLRTLTRRQLELFIDVSMRADGHAQKMRLAQKSTARSEAFAFACILAGKPVSYVAIENDHNHGLEIGVLVRTQFAPLQHSNNADERPFSVERIEHEGIVWCPTTPNGTWLARRKGTVYWTGNTDNETWAGNVHPHQALRAYRDKTGINAKLAVVAMTATEFSIADPSDVGMLDFIGFDAAAPSVLADFVRR